MSNWWDAAPLANAPKAAAPTGDNWWDAAPLAKDDNQPVIPPVLPPSNGGNGGGTPPRQGIGDSLAGYAGKIRNGLTFGFGDNFSAGVATLPNMAVSALRGNEVGSIPENYNKLLASDRKLTNDFTAEHPVIGTGAEIAGGVTSGGALGKALPSVFGLGTKGGSIIQGAKSGLTQGAVFGAGAGDENGMLRGAASGAGYGAVGGAVLGPVANAVGGFARGIAGKAPAVGPTAAELRANSGQLYKQATEKGGTLKSNVIDSWVDEVKGMLPQTPEGRTILGENDVTKLAGRITDEAAGLGGKPLNLQAAQEIDEALTSQISNHTDAITGKVSKEGFQLQNIQRSLRNKINNASEADIEGGKAGFDSWNQAKKTWAQSTKAAEIERIIERANMTDNPASALKTGFKNYVTKKENLNGLSKEQVSALKDAANTGIATDAFRIFGSRLIPYAAGAAGTTVGGPLGAAVGAAGGYAGSSLSRNVATGLQNARAGNALNMITAGERLPSAAENLGSKARSAFGLTGAPEVPNMSGGAAVNPAVQQQPTIQRAPQSGTRLNSRPEVSAAIGASVLPAVVGTGMLAQSASQSPRGPDNNFMAPPPPNNDVVNPQEFNHDDFLDTLTNGVESNGERNAKNPKSSALGPYQIIRSTFAGLVKKYDPETYKKGNFQQLRSDPEYAKKIARFYSQENVDKLVSEGLPINKTTAYLAWFADGKTAAKLLKSPANASASSVFSSQALEANPFLKGKTVGQVVQWAQKKVNRA